MEKTRISQFPVAYMQLFERAIVAGPSGFHVPCKSARAARTLRLSLYRFRRVLAGLPAHVETAKRFDGVQILLRENALVLVHVDAAPDAQHLQTLIGESKQ